MPVDLDGLSFAEDDGFGTDLLVLNVAAAAGGRRARHLEALPVRRRPGGFMVCVAPGSYPPSRLRLAQTAGMGALLGPSREVEVDLDPLLVADDDGTGLSPRRANAVFIDFSDAAAELFEVFGGEEDEAAADVSRVVFDSSGRLPSDVSMMGVSAAWLSDELPEGSRVRGYVTAEEDAGEAGDSIDGGFQSAEAALVEESRPSSGARTVGEGGRSRFVTPAAKRLASASSVARDASIEAAAGGTGRQLDLMERMLARLEAVEQRLASSASGPPPPPTSGPPPLLGGDVSTTLGAAARLAGGGPPRQGDAGARSAGGGGGGDELDLDGAMAGLLDDPEGAARTDALTRDLLVQTAALTRLMKPSDDLMARLEPGASSGSSASSRGALQRARLQQMLGHKSMVFATQVRANMSRRLGPLRNQHTPDPLEYVERFGSFGGGLSDTGHIQWIFAHLLRALWMEDTALATDICALAFAATEQASMEGGLWEVAFMLTLLSEPPPAILDRRPPRAGASSLQAFSHLHEQQWTAVLMCYLKELDLLNARKRELGDRRKSDKPDKKGDAEKDDPSAKPKPKPKKPAKGAAAPEPKE